MSSDADFAAPLREEDVDPDPFEQFAKWFKQAGDAGVRAPEAAALATASADGAPSVRMVLVKASGTDGVVFYSNYESRKGQELAANPRAALLFHWDPLGRQVRAEGPVERLTPEESAIYIRTRPRASQLGALASPQSQVISSRDELKQRVARLANQYGDGDLPLPETWGGFRLRPNSIEFWQHREDRLHDRLLYTHEDDGGWRLQRLAP
jgi:pyridoxamine 5'-phosphate oxidase